MKKKFSWKNFRPPQNNNFQKVIVSGIHKMGITFIKDNKELNGTLSSELPRESLRDLCVGDFIDIEERSDNFFVKYCYPRNNFLSRTKNPQTKREYRQIIVANIDQAIIVFCPRNPKFNSRLLDRYLVIIQHSGIEPLICINKIDLDPGFNKINWYQEKLKIPIIRTSTITQEGISLLRKRVENKKSVFLGTSGVGKSSLINLISSKRGNLSTQQVNPKTGKGRHTTTKSSIIPISDNYSSFIIDTPGLRSLSLRHINSQKIKDYFPEIKFFSKDCEFKGCLHTKEKNCAVKQAVLQKKIPLERYKNYLKIYQEVSGG